jgi:predicted house-cleaning noncanonical NTP pyrophosphatase (MazG superfamily)
VRITYGKLIRDRIPEVLEAEGLRYEVATLDEAGYRAALLAKLQEEAAEATGAGEGEALVVELADLLEVVDALLASEGIERERVLEEQARRREARGGFERRLELRWTEG